MEYNLSSSPKSPSVVVTSCLSSNLSYNTSCGAAMSADSRYKSSLSPTADVLLACYILLVCILSVVLNLLVIVTVAKRRRSVSPLEIYVVNMAVVDLCPTILAYPATAASGFAHGWVLGEIGCALSGLSVYFFGIAAISNLTVMSIMRYIVTCRHKSADTVSRKLVIWTLIPIYGNAVIWCTTPLAGWGSYGPEQSGISCALEWRNLPLSYVICIFLLLFVIPVFVMVFCYSSIIREVYITQKGTQMIRKRMDIYMFKMTVIMTLCFLVAWTPYSVLAFMAASRLPDQVPLALTVAAAFMAKSSSFYNPVVYVFTVKRFRDEIAQTLCGWLLGSTKAAHAQTIGTRFSIDEEDKSKPGHPHQRNGNESLLSKDQESSTHNVGDDLPYLGPAGDDIKMLLLLSEKNSTQLTITCEVEEDEPDFQEMLYPGPSVSSALLEGQAGQGIPGNSDVLASNNDTSQLGTMLQHNDDGSENQFSLSLKKIMVDFSQNSVCPNYQVNSTAKLSEKLPENENNEKSHGMLCVQDKDHCQCPEEGQKCVKNKIMNISCDATHDLCQNSNNNHKVSFNNGSNAFDVSCEVETFNHSSNLTVDTTLLGTSKSS